MSNSRVESHSRAELRNKIISAATLLEILLSGLVLIGLLLSMVPLLQWMPGLLFDGNDVEVSIFLQRALDIVIGIEFIKMLAKHSPGSSLEVLLYAIARHMVVGHVRHGEPAERERHRPHLHRAEVLLRAGLRRSSARRPPRTRPFPQPERHPVRGIRRPAAQAPAS